MCTRVTRNWRLAIAVISKLSIVGDTPEKVRGSAYAFGEEEEEDALVEELAIPEDPSALFELLLFIELSAAVANARFLRAAVCAAIKWRSRVFSNSALAFCCRTNSCAGRFPV